MIARHKDIADRRTLSMSARGVWRELFETHPIGVSTTKYEVQLELADPGAGTQAFIIPQGTSLNLQQPLGGRRLVQSGGITLTSRRVTIWTDGSVTISEIDARFGNVTVERQHDDGSREYVKTLPPERSRYETHPWRSEPSVRPTHSQ